MSNLTTKNCDHKTCEKLYATDSNNWWWAYRYKQAIIFAHFDRDLIIDSPGTTSSIAEAFVAEGVLHFQDKTVLNKDANEVMHFCGQEHLMSWVNENVGRINESQQRTTEAPVK